MPRAEYSAFPCRNNQVCWSSPLTLNSCCPAGRSTVSDQLSPSDQSITRRRWQEGMTGGGAPLALLSPGRPPHAPAPCCTPGMLCHHALVCCHDNGRCNSHKACNRASRPRDLYPLPTRLCARPGPPDPAPGAAVQSQLPSTAVLPTTLSTWPNATRWHTVKVTLVHPSWGTAAAWVAASAAWHCVPRTRWACGCAGGWGGGAQRATGSGLQMLGRGGSSRLLPRVSCKPARPHEPHSRWGLRAGAGTAAWGPAAARLQPGTTQVCGGDGLRTVTTALQARSLAPLHSPMPQHAALPSLRCGTRAAPWRACSMTPSISAPCQGSCAWARLGREVGGPLRTRAGAPICKTTSARPLPRQHVLQRSTGTPGFAPAAAPFTPDPRAASVSPRRCRRNHGASRPSYDCGGSLNWSFRRVPAQHPPSTNTCCMI